MERILMRDYERLLSALLGRGLILEVYLVVLLVLLRVLRLMMEVGRGVGRMVGLRPVLG